MSITQTAPPGMTDPVLIADYRGPSYERHTDGRRTVPARPDHRRPAWRDERRQQ